MSDNKKTFHEWALESILFKGHYDWYFCFLKAERIAHVLSLLAEKVVHSDRGWFEELVDRSARLAPTIVHFAAEEASIEAVLADTFSLISVVRLSGTRGYLAQDTAQYIAQEYELIAQKISSGNQLSPFVSPQDFSVPDFLSKPKAPEALSLGRIHTPPPIQKSQPKKETTEGAPVQTDRKAAILHFVLQKRAVSIKEICAVVPDCSEKTVQRELGSLIAAGLIIREGERRWSVYKPA
jgi:hypothetical protein